MSYCKEDIRKRLLKESDEKYKKFSSALLPTTEQEKILGVRLPVLRKFAREIYKNGGTVFLQENNLKYFEEIMLQGMIIGLVKDDDKVIKKYIKNFIPKIDNWSVCDSFCCSLKFVKGREKNFLEFIKPYLHSKKEYEVRFAVVILLDYYICDKYIDTVLNLLEQVKHEGYYAKMATAWAISMCYVKYPQKTFEFLKNTKLNSQTVNKAVQKITESLKVDSEAKKKVISLKRLY